MDRPRRVLITGPRRGIGRTIAEAFSKAGDQLVFVGRQSDELVAFAEAHRAHLLPADLSDRKALENVVAQLEQQAPIDVLINNAGIAESAPLGRTTDRIWDQTMFINATVPFLLCRALAPRMTTLGFGRIINVASTAGRIGYAYTSAYCASKHALIGLTRALAAEFAKTHVTVNAICPGWVDTDMAHSAASRIAATTKRNPDEAMQTLMNMSPQGRLIEAREVAALCLMLASEDAKGIHGQAIVIDGGQVMA